MYPSIPAWNRRDRGAPLAGADEFTPRIAPNYVKRSLATLPHFYGTYDLPSIDNLVSYRFDPRRFSFS